MTASRLFRLTFTSNSSWQCPAGIKFVIITGCGGGGGGGGGAAVSGAAFLDYYACGGSGGQPSQTSTHVIEVTPGVTYSITIGGGGAGGAFSSTPNWVDGGGATKGNPGSNGGSTLFGTLLTFIGGLGGRRGEIIYPAGPSNPSGIASGLVAITSPAFAATSGFTRITKGGGGGTGGGASNNVLSYGGVGGHGAFGFDAGVPAGTSYFSTNGSPGYYGGGGGGGGGGEGHDYNNTHDGSGGGAGGAGFLEIAWIQ